MWVFLHYLPYFFKHSFRTTCWKKNGIPFGALVPFPSHKEPELLYTCWVLNLNPIVMSRRTTLERVDHEFWKKKKINNNTCKICYKIPTTFSSNIASLVYLKRQESTYFSLQLLLKFFLFSIKNAFIFLNSSTMMNNTLYCTVKKLKWK